MKEKDRIISELNEDIKSTKEELEGLAKVIEQEKNEKDITLKQLQDDVAEGKMEQNRLQQIVDNLKAKNNVSVSLFCLSRIKLIYQNIHSLETG